MSNKSRLRRFTDAIPWLIFALTLLYFVGYYFFSYRFYKLAILVPALVTLYIVYKHKLKTTRKAGKISDAEK